MKRATEFYYWFRKLGGNVSLLEAEEIIRRTNTVHLKMNGFRHKAQEIKAKYNYTFSNVKEYKKAS
jgi:hypothetical protein